MLIHIISDASKGVLSFGQGLFDPFIKLLREDNNDDEGKCNDVLSKLSFSSSHPSWTRQESSSPTTNTLGESSLNFIRPLVMRVVCGCIKALPSPVKSVVVTSIDQLKPLVDNIASGILDGIVEDNNLLHLTLPAESKLLVATTSELVVASSTELVAANGRSSLAEMNDDGKYYPNALKFIVIGCLIIMLAFGCGIILSDATVFCLSIFQAVILEKNYQMISSFIAVMMKCLVMIFGVSSADVDLDEVANDDEIAAPTLRSSSLRLDMPSSTASNELVASDVSIDMPYKSCLVALLLLIFTSLVDIVDTLSGIDWLILLTLVASMIIIITTASSKQSVLSTVDALTDLTTTTASVSSALSDIDDANLASRRYCSQSETTLTLSNWKLPPTVPFNLMGTLRACLSSVLQHVRQERHSLLVAFLLMASAPIAVIIAVLMVLDFWMTIQALVVATCLIYAITYTTKVLQSIPTRLRGSTTALVDRICRLNPITTICNIITDESCLLTSLLMVLVPLMGIVVIMTMLILASFNWSVVVQVLAECMMMIPRCLPIVRQACGVVMIMMCLKIITYCLLRMWQYQLSVALNFLDLIGASGPLVNVMIKIFGCISFALAYYVGRPTAVRDILYSATTRTLNSIWMIFASVVKKFIYLIAYTSILLVHVFIMLVQSIDCKAVMYTVAYLIRLPINIIWGMVGRLAGALLGCIVCLYTNVLAPSDQVEEKEPLPPVGVAISDDEDSDDDDSTIDFGGADPIDNNYDVDCVDVPLLPPPQPKRRIRRRRKEYPPAVWHRGRGGRGGRLRPRRTKPG